MTEDGAFHLAGDRLGKFVILSELGRGSMGVVYEALQEDLKRKVALKILPANITLDAKQVRRFQREAESVARLRHANVIQIYEVGEIDHTHYFAMELVDGRPLSEESGRDRESIYRAARICMEAARGLAHAHEKGVIHRDIKPGNLLVDRKGRVAVSDFGLARLTDSASLTSTDAIVGTPKYMSPEQILPLAGQELDGRTDVYSLGATLFHVVAGRPPFEAPSVQAFIRCILEERASSPRKFNRQVPHDLATIILRCLEKDPDDRYAGATEMADDLERFLAGERIKAKPKGVLAIATESIRRHKIIAALSVVTAIAIVLGLVLGGKAAESTRRAQFEAKLRSIVGQDDLDLAVQAIEELAEANPGNEEIDALRTRVYRNRALKQLEAAELDPESVIHDLERAGLKGTFWHLMMLLELNRREDARVAAEALPASSSLARLVLAQIALATRDYEEVHRLLPEPPIDPEYPQETVFYALVRAAAYQEAGDLTRARELLRVATQETADTPQAWLRVRVTVRRLPLQGGANLGDVLDTIGDAFRESMLTLTKLRAAMTPKEAAIAERFVESILRLAGERAVPSFALEQKARDRLKTAVGRERAIADLMLAVARLSQGDADDAEEALDDARQALRNAGDQPRVELDPYVFWCRSLVHRARDSLVFSIQYGGLAISYAPVGFRDLEQLCRHTTLLIEAGWQEKAANADDAAAALRTKLAGLRPAGLGTWVTELLGRLSPPVSRGG